MTGSKINMMDRETLLKATEDPPPGGDYVWDGEDEDDRPVTDEELGAARTALRGKRGRPPGSTKVSTTVRFDREVLDAFRATGPGWQSRMNQALKDWLKIHPPGSGG